MAKILIPAIAGGAALALVGTAAIATALQKNDVTLTVDGVSSSIAVRETTVGDVLDLQGIALGTHDVVLPAADTTITDGMEISVAYGRELALTVDGEQRTVWTTAQTVGQALSQLQLDDADSKLSATRSVGIGREGLDLEVSTPKEVTLKADGASAAVRAAGTVADLLAQEGIEVDADDEVKPSPETELSEGMTVKYVDVEVRTSTKKVSVAYDTKKVKTDKLAKGTTKVTTEGVKGKATETHTDTYRNGKLVSSELTSTRTTKEPVTEVVRVGTKETESTAQSDLTPASGTTCRASYYDTGSVTANGESFNPDGLTAAHLSFPFGTKLKVTNKANGRTTIVRINDRGPYVGDRCLDLSRGAMRAVGGLSSGIITLTYEVVS